MEEILESFWLLTISVSFVPGMSRCVSSLATHTGPLVSVCWLRPDILEHWQHVRLWQCMGQTGANRGKQTSLPANTTNILSCRGREWVWMWPPDTMVGNGRQHFPFLSVYEGNHQWFIRKCTVPTINTVHIRILLKPAVLESNLKAIFSYKGGFRVTFQVAVQELWQIMRLDRACDHRPWLNF